MVTIDLVPPFADDHTPPFTRDPMRTTSLLTGILSPLIFSVGCAAVDVDDDSPDGSDADGAGGAETADSGGTTASGGWVSGSGGSRSGGAGNHNSGGGFSSGGVSNSGGATPSGGQANTGGFSFPGSGGAGNNNSGGAGNGGAPAAGGGQATGGQPGAGGGGTVELDCDAQMPTSGGEQHSATWAEGGTGNTAWQIWTNGGPGNLTSFGTTPAFIASWNNSGDYLGRMGFEWGNSGKQYTEYGTIKADYVWNKSGNAGQYSYIGVYGWSTNPCVEWYIVEDSFHPMPFNTGDQPVGTVDIDGGTYNLVYRHTQGTGGDRCGGAGSWDQFYSIRLEGKRCGTMTISDHFDAWADRGWNLGNLLEVKIVVEAAAGTGSVEFPVANVTTSQ